MRIQDSHAHAITKYRLLKIVDFFWLAYSVADCKFNNYKSLTAHLPFELQHPEVQNLTLAYLYINFGQFLKKIFKVKLYWENAPWLSYGTWNLKYQNTNWQFIPKNIDLCLDTGHLMLGCKNKNIFLKTLQKTLKTYGRQIKYLHLHENNFVYDAHRPIPGKIIDKKLFKLLTKNRDYIIEKGE